MTFHAVDASIWIDLHDRYPQDVFPSIWDLFNGLIANGELQSPDEVKVEITRRKKPIEVWARSQTGLFCPLEPAIQVAAAALLVKYPDLTDPDSERGMADPFVVALAQVKGADTIVVSGESKKGGPTKTIPDVCAKESITCMKLLDFLRARGVKL